MGTDIFTQQKRQWIDEARQVAHKLLSEYYSITIDDVLRIHPLPKFLHRNTVGAVFSQREFKKLGLERSTTPQSHGHIITRWTAKLASDYEIEPELEIPRYKKLLRRDYQEVQE